MEGLKHLITRQMCSSFILVLCLDDPDRNEFMDSWVGVKADHMSDYQTFLLCIQPSPVGQLGLEKPLTLLIDLGKGSIKHIKLHCQQ